LNILEYSVVLQSVAAMLLIIHIILTELNLISVKISYPHRFSLKSCFFFANFICFFLRYFYNYLLVLNKICYLYKQKLILLLLEFILSFVSYSVVFEASINYINKRTIYTGLRHSHMTYRQYVQIWLDKKILPPRFPYIYSFLNTTQICFILDTSLSSPLFHNTVISV
jgi:hypothetical protein